jgi:uncharacterized protein
MSKEKIFMGSYQERPTEKTVKSITLCVTEDCNLICKYCYLKGKNSNNRMNLDTAKKVIDYILADRNFFYEDMVLWDFIGGEPFLEIELIDKISDYIKEQIEKLNHPWSNNYFFNIASNGLLYGTKKVQEYIVKNKGHLSIGLSIDGNKAKHDQQRIKPDGSGSYDDIMKNAGLWIKQFPDQSTKATFAHEDLIHLKDSVINLWDNGIKNVMANVIFEDVWQEGDDLVFEKQLIELADYIIEKKLWKEFNIKFFDYTIGLPLAEKEKNFNNCKAGKSFAVDTKGRFFPCIRFLDFSMNNKKSLCIGNFGNGIDEDKFRPFYNLSLRSQSTEECMECEVASGCSWCNGYNYDYADTVTIYQRMTNICKMHKANARACDYFWNKLKDVLKEDTPRDNFRKEKFKSNEKPAGNDKYLFFISSDEVTPHCNYRNKKNTKNIMDKVTLKKGIEFAKKNGMSMIFIGNNQLNDENDVYIKDQESTSINESDIIVYDNKIETIRSGSGNCILLLSKDNIYKMIDFIKALYTENNRINLILEDVKEWTQKDLDDYESGLKSVSDFILETYQAGKPLELNVLSDLLDLNSMCNCNAGVDSFTLAPNGKFYICPAFYFEDPDDDIGDTENGIRIKNSYLMDIKSAECCLICDAYHCKRCKYLNNKYTGEIHIPSKNQCLTSHIERNATRILQQRLIEKGYIDPSRRIIKIDHLDPTELVKKGKRKI